MHTTHHDDQTLRSARRAAGRKLGFYVHATVFVLVNLALAATDLATGRHGWSLFPALGWGLGLAIHGFVALGPVERLHRALVDREIARLDGDR